MKEESRCYIAFRGILVFFFFVCVCGRGVGVMVRVRKLILSVLAYRVIACRVIKVVKILQELVESEPKLIPNIKASLEGPPAYVWLLLG